ncbi:hypothetical protein [Lewinella sp. IMCC34183]|uniref:hypothetical protein n=1 Tax=Lewinella sp. IMCC34183 TaxID=2248762 RepID=UPI000E26C6CB|nr:hypothetical protein [Lewinella sp. IMCC34183]
MIDESPHLTLSPEDVRNFRKAGVWSRLVGVVGMVGLGLFLVVIVVYSGIITGLTGLAMNMPGGGMAVVSVVLVIYVGILLLLGYLAYLLFTFGKSAVAASDAGDHAALSGAMTSLSRLFLIYGILTIAYATVTAGGYLYSLWVMRGMAL